MHIASYRFDGDPDDLQARYDKMLAGFPPGMILLNLCVRRDDGITIIDACPTVADFEAFSTGEEFAAALASVGLPTPQIDLHGSAVATGGFLVAAPA